MSSSLSPDLEVGTLEGEQINVTTSIGVITTESAPIADSKSGREIRASKYSPGDAGATPEPRTLALSNGVWNRA